MITAPQRKPGESSGLETQTSGRDDSERQFRAAGPGFEKSLRRAVFLDRDGTLIEDVGYLDTVENVRILPGAVDALRRLCREGYMLVVVTNQSAVARGLLSEEELSGIHGFIVREFGEKGAPLSAIYYCPHHPQAPKAEYRKDCECRKPAPGLLLRSASEMGIDLSRSWMIGDSGRDVEAGLRAGCRAAILIGPSGDAPPSKRRGSEPQTLEHRVADLLAAAKLILGADS